MTKHKLRFLMAHDKQLYSTEIDKLYKTVNDRRSADGMKVLSLNELNQKSSSEDTSKNGDSTEKSQNSDELGKPSPKPAKKFNFGGLSAAKKKKQAVQTSNSVESSKRPSSTPELEDTFTVSNIKDSTSPFHVNDATSDSKKNILVDGISGNSTVIIDNSPNSYYSSAKIRNISHSLVYLKDAVKGPVYLEDVTHSIVVVRDCQQLRMHDSSSTLVVVACDSMRPIIEECNKMVFAQTVDLIIDKGTSDYESLSKKKWETVDDFNWLVPDVPSKNWRPLKSEIVENTKNGLSNMLKGNLKGLDVDQIVEESFK